MRNTGKSKDIEAGSVFLGTMPGNKPFPLEGGLAFYSLSQEEPPD
jgi:hypothetical protein